MAKAGRFARQDAELREILDREATHRARRMDAPSRNFSTDQIFFLLMNELHSVWKLI